jgi:uncharacterized membrane protein
VKKITTKQIALISVFAALLAIISRLPGIPILAGSGNIEFTTLLYPFIGIVLGPWIGMVAVILGNIIVWLIPATTVFGLLMTFSGAIAAMVCGFLSREDPTFNWKAAAVVMGGLDLLWYLTPVGLQAPFYPILHWLAFALIIIFRNRINEYIWSPSRKMAMMGVGISSYIGTMAEHMTGNLIFIEAIDLIIPLKTLRDTLRLWGMTISTGVGVPDDPLAQIFMLVLPVSAVERMIITIAATIIGVAAIRMLGKGRLLAFSQG